MALIGATNQQRVKILEEVNETNANKLDENKNIIKQWIEMQPHLPKNYDERVLASFIRGCKHDVERVKRKLDNYFTYRAIMPDLFANRDPTTPEMTRLKDQFIACPLPDLTSSGCRITLHKLMMDEKTNIDIRSIVRYLLMIGDVRLIEEGPISGDIFIFDVCNVKASLVSKLLNPLIKKGIMCTQNALPQRLKAIHVINAPSYLDTGVNIIKMFVKDKIKERFHVFSDLESLYKYVPKDSLPCDYGGKEKSVAALQNEWLKKLESYRPYFEEQESIFADESKRLNKPEPTSREYEELFGTTGSFHKLSID